MPKHGRTVDDVCVFSLCISGTQNARPRGNEALLEAVVRQAKVTRLPWLIGSTKEKCTEEEEEKEDSEARRIRDEIAQGVVAGIKEKASAHEEAKLTAQ